MASRAKLGVERDTPMSNRLRSYKRKNHVSSESTSGTTGAFKYSVLRFLSIVLGSHTAAIGNIDSLYMAFHM